MAPAELPPPNDGFDPFEPPAEIAGDGGDAPRYWDVIPAVAGFQIRAVARVVDTFVGAGLGAVGGGLAVLLIAATGGDLGELVDGPLFTFVGVAIALGSGVIADAIAETYFGATVGKLVCGLRVRGEDGEPPSFSSATKRSLAYFVDALFFGIVAYNAMQGSIKQQRLGDRWGKTVVVHVKASPPAAMARTAGAWLALVAAMAVVVVSQAIAEML